MKRNIRELSGKIAEDRRFSNFVTFLIVVNAITIGMETYRVFEASLGAWFNFFNNFVLAIFIVEAALKITAVAPRFMRYFKDAWNLFDFTIIILALIPAVGALAMVARLARLLRVLRLITKLRELRIIISTLLRSIPSIANVLILLFIVFYVYGVMGYHFFHEQSPQYWGTLHTSLLTLFRIVTMDGWSDVMYAVLATNALAPLYFISFILIGALVMLNLFIGVILLNIGEAKKESLDELERPTTKEDILHSLTETKKSIEKLESQLKRHEES